MNALDDSPSPHALCASAVESLAAIGRLGPEIASVKSVPDEGLIDALGLLEAVGRMADAARIITAAEIADRSRRSLGSEGLAARKGCRSGVELVRRVTGVAAATAARRISLGAAALTRVTLTGHEAPARFPAVGAALIRGAIGFDSACAVVDGLAPVEGRVPIEQKQAAEKELVGAAARLGTVHVSPESGHPTAAVGSERAASDPEPQIWTADDTRLQARVWCSVLDPDGIEPAEERAMMSRGLRLGRERNGTVKLSGELVSTSAAQLRKVFDAYLNPKSGPTFNASDVGEYASAGQDTGIDRDPRSPDQKRHDALVAMVDHAARCAETPSLGGASPTVFVAVSADELVEGAENGTHHAGAGFVEGVEAPVSTSVVRQYACAGGVQRAVLGETGNVVELGSPQRCFTGRQRRVLAVRDGGCIIPGCGIPASWCEVHHVQEHAAGGPTHTDNGVLLCWFHHRTLDTSGWQIRMRQGSPQVKPPPWVPGASEWRFTHHAAVRHRRRCRNALSQPLQQERPDN